MFTRSFSSKAIPSKQSEEHAKLLERVAQINDYYSQYVEEYTEVDEIQEEKREERKRDEKIAKTLPEIVDLLRERKAMNIAVFTSSHQYSTPTVSTVPQPPYTVICSPQNPRHSKAIAMSLSDSTKYDSGEGTRRIAKQSNGWLIVHIEEADTVIHLMDEEVREYFNLESMLSGLEDEDKGGDGDEEIPLIPKSK